MRILTVGLERELFSRFRPMLAHQTLEVDRMPLGQSVIGLSSKLQFDLVLVGYPLPDMTFDELLALIRRPTSPCADSEIIVLVEEKARTRLAQYLGKENIHIVSLSEPQVQLFDKLHRFLGLAPRAPKRLLVSLEAVIDDGVSIRSYQTTNISTTGMLAWTDRLLPIGTTVRVKLELPEDGLSILATAEVVRHTLPKVENVRGIGLKFVDFLADGKKRLEDYLSRELPLEE